MILKEEKKVKIEGHKFEAQKSVINENKLKKLFGVLSGLYRNIPGSIVREITSNAVDANMEAHHFKTLEYEELKKQYSWIEDPKFNITPDSLEEIKKHLIKAGEKEPIIIKIDHEKNELTIRDYGIGLSPERAKHIYFNYLDSTKEDTDELLGGFGLGSKSPLSYRENFFIDTVYNGTKYSYMMSKDEFGLPQHELLLLKENIEEDNGTIIRIPFKIYSDYIDFSNEIKKQLTYIDNVYFIMGDSENNSINDNVIYSNSLWKFSTSNSVQEMHICYNNILYTIDWTELSIPSIQLPIGLIFNTNELKPIPSRESIEYNANSRKLIIERIEEVKKWFLEKMIEKYKTEYVNVFNFSSIMKGSVIYNIDDRYTLDLNNIGIKPIDLDIKIKYFDTTMLREYTAKSGIINRSTLPFIKSAKVDYSYTFSNYNYMAPLTVSDTKNNNSFILLNEGESISGEKIHYMMDTSAIYYPIVLRKDKWNLRKYKEIMGLSKFPKEDWREIIKAYQESITDYIGNLQFFNTSDYVVNPNWYRDYMAGNTRFKKVSKKVKTTVEKAEDEFLVNILNTDGVFRKEYCNIKFFEDYKTVIYDVPEEENRLKMLQTIFISLNMPVKDILFLSTCRRNYNTFGKLKIDNLKSYEEYMKSESEELKNIATGYACNESLKYYFIKDNTVFDYSEPLKEVYYKALTYSKGFKKWNFPISLAKEIYTVMEEKGEIDYALKKEVDKLVELINDIPVLNFMSFSYGTNANDIIIVLDNLGFPLDKKYSDTITERKFINFIDRKYGNYGWEYIE